MILHALTIVVNELNRHLLDQYGAGSSTNPAPAALGNLAEGFGSGLSTIGIPREFLYLTLVNIREEKTLKNVPHFVRDDAAQTVVYDNPPVFLNLLVLLTATHSNYHNALLVLSRAIRFLQAKHVFTQDNVDPASLLTANGVANALDQLESFKLIFDLYSPTMEEINHLWGTLGGKQYPFVLYLVRMLPLKTRMVNQEIPAISELANDHSGKDSV